MPRRLTAVAIETDAPPRKRIEVPPRKRTGEPSRKTIVRPMAPPIVEMAKVWAWLLELSPPSTRTVITAAVASVSVIAGITVAMTLG
jgi:hypothetical protein